MILDREKIRFKGKAIKAAIDLNASISDEEATPFFEQLYREYQSILPSLSPEAWLRQRLSNTFISMTVPPTWVEDEPAWLFFEGEPMVFISQTTVPESEVSKQSLSPGETIYVFGIRRPVARGFQMIYRTVSQFRELNPRANP